MAAVHVRDIPNEILEALKRRAERHERSLQVELRHILASAAQEDEPPSGTPPLDLHYSDAVPRTNWSREEIYGEDGR